MEVDLQGCFSVVENFHWYQDLVEAQRNSEDSLELGRSSPGAVGGCCKLATQLIPSKQTNEVMDLKKETHIMYAPIFFKMYCVG
jgi:hypothetical protein